MQIYANEGVGLETNQIKISGLLIGLLTRLHQQRKKDPNMQMNLLLYINKNIFTKKNSF